MATSLGFPEFSPTDDANLWTKLNAISEALNDYLTALVNDLPVVDQGFAEIDPVANTQTTLAVAFNFTFPSTPHVILQQRTGVGSGTTSFVWPSAISTTGFTLNIMRSNATADVSVSWTAIRVP